VIKVIAISALALGLSGCAGFTLPGVSGSGTAANAALHDFLTDPSCAHDDEATFVTGAGGLPASFQAKVSRHCEARPPVTTWAPAPATGPVAP